MASNRNFDMPVTVEETIAGSGSVLPNAMARYAAARKACGKGAATSRPSPAISPSIRLGGAPVIRVSRVADI